MRHSSRRHILGNLLGWQGTMLTAGVFSLLRRAAAGARSSGQRPERTLDLARDDRGGSGTDFYVRGGSDRPRVAPPRYSVKRRG